MRLSGGLPYEPRPTDGDTVRRHQLEVIANARETRLIEEAVRSSTATTGGM